MSAITVEHRALAGQLVRYGITGGLATIVNYAVFWAAFAFAGLHPNLAWTLGFVCAVGVSYVVNSRWSFRGHGRRDSLARTGGRFAVVSLISFGLNSLWVWLLVSHLRWPAWTPFPFVVGLTPLFVFSLNRAWVFK